MKHFLLFLFLFSGFAAFNQVNVVVIPVDTTVCFRDSVAFSTIITGSGTSKISYQWQKNYIDLTGSGANDSIFSIAHVLSSSPGIYRCIISVEGLGADTSNDVMLRMHPRMYIDSLYRYNPLGCREDCKGQFKARVSGGTPFKSDFPYIYEWHGGFSQDTLVFGLCPARSYIFTVTDSLGCSLDSAYFVDYLKSPKITFDIKPDTVIYLTNPNVQVAFPDSMKKYISNWTWDFGDSVKVANLNPATHTYKDTIKPGQVPIRLTITDLHGCDTTITREVTVKVAELDIPNLFTPNGDGINDKFAIELMDDKKKDYREAYLGNEILIFDRWGKKVFNTVNYKSEDWDGERLSDGTYFYILKLTGQYKDEVQKGSVTILRGK
ncbi:MAG: gliding motility-associated C-terminal domain-containing protein [Bacteroidales bacterium]|nr:gliding motility-associated C-terminal domain-containing protein [Bacteroidales bacterium]